MPRSVKRRAKPAAPATKPKRTTIDWKDPVWGGLEAAAKQKQAEFQMRVTPTHIIRMAVDRFLEELQQGHQQVAS